MLLSESPPSSESIPRALSPPPRFVARDKSGMVEDGQSLASSEVRGQAVPVLEEVGERRPGDRRVHGRSITRPDARPNRESWRSAWNGKRNGTTLLQPRSRRPVRTAAATQSGRA